MERQRKSRISARLAKNAPKRVAAFFLAAALVLSNVGTQLNVSYASTGEEITFQMRGADLAAAVNEAVMDGHEVTADDLNFTNGKTAEFESMFFSEGQGTVYEIFPELEGGSMDAELRIFVRLPEDADEMYTVTGKEEIILLYVNNGSESISCNTEIIRMVDGEEKIKKTKRVNVRSFEDAFGDEEVNIISKPVEETTAPDTEETVKQEETSASEETSESIEDSGMVETVQPPEDENADETTDAAAGNETEAETDHTASDLTDAAVSDEGQESSSETEKAEKTETEKAEAPETEKAEPKETEKAEEAEEAEPVASITRHFAPVVADKEDADAPAAKAEETEEAKARETEAEVKEIEVKETEAKDTEIKETSGKSEEASSGSDEESVKEEGETASTTEDGKNTIPSEEENTEHSAEAGSNSSESDAGSADISTSGETTDAADMSSGTETASDTASSETETGAPAAEETPVKARITDLVGMGYCSTAKVYTATLNELKALDDFDGYKISYSVFPETSARIVEGSRGVNEGEGLSFGVKNQTGYEVQYVMVNDEEVEAESVTNNDDGSRTTWYNVPEVNEEQDVEVYMLENLEHPAFDKSVEVNGVTIRVTAPEGVLPADTDIQAEEITEQVESAVTELVTAESDNVTSVSTVIAYDINLVYDGLKLDNSWAEGENSCVTVSFSGDRIARASKDADEVEVLHVETPTETVEAVSAAAELGGEEENKTVAEVPVLDNLTADNISVDSEGRQAVDVSGDTLVGEIDFTTTHFSAFTLVFKNSPYLIITNTLASDSQSANGVKYEYEVTLQPVSGKETFSYLDENGEEKSAGDVQSMGALEDGSVTYSFTLGAGGRLKIGNVKRDAKYQVMQKERDYNTCSVSVKETNIDWSEVESENVTVTDKEVFPYGYSSDKDAYGSMMERAGALMRSYRKCRIYDEDKSNQDRDQRKRLIESANNDVSNSKIIEKFIKDNGNWLLASDQGLQEVVNMAKANLDGLQTDINADKKVDLSESLLKVYFRVKTSNPEQMEVVPYLYKAGDPQWRAYAVYNSSDQSWYQYLATDNDSQFRKYVGRDLAILNTEDMSIDKIIAMDNSDNSNPPKQWVKLTHGEVNEPDYSQGSKNVEGDFEQSGFLRGIEVIFTNNYFYEGSDDDNSGKDNESNIPDDNDKPDNPDNGTNTDNPDDSTTPDTPDNNITPDNNQSGTSDNTNISDSGNSSSGGSSGTSTAGRYQGSDAQNGPGAMQTVIAPEDVPLAALPVDGVAAAGQAMAIIDDGEIPLASIPKTGSKSDSAHELAFILSGILLALYTALGSKKKKES